MKRTLTSNIVVGLCLCLWLSSSSIGHDTAGGWRWLSLHELDQKSTAQLQKDKRRLRGLMTNVDPFTQRPDTWKIDFDDLTKAKLIVEIVELQYLARALQIDDAQVVEKHPHKAEFELDRDPVRITIVQRTAKSIPGFPAAVKVEIDDITAGQVLLEIICEGIAKPVVDTISVRVGDVTPFTLGGREFYLSVIKLRNFVFGNDYAVFEITTKQPDERAQIEQLLGAIESSGLTFIRNGKASTASEASAHLRKKWKHARPEIVTVNGFIERIASRSSTTGEKYEVRLADESAMDAGTWMRRQLENIDQEQAE